MAFYDRILSAINLTTAATAEAASARAYEAGYFDANDEPASGDLRSYGYRRQLATGLRDFTKMSHDEIIEIVWTLYQSNPIAKRYLQIKRDHIIGRGVAISADDKKLAAVIDGFFEHNSLHTRLPKLTLQLFLWGEQCYTAYTRKADGQVTLGYIDPGEIEAVITHPNNAMEAYAVVCKLRTTDPDKRVYRIARRDKGYTDGDRVYSANYPDKLVGASQARLEPWELKLLAANGLKQYTGTCFYFTVNNVSNQPRGFSDLLQIADWLDSHDETLFALADREQFAGYFSWDVKLTGATEEQVKARAKAIRNSPPKRGSVNVHNDAEEWMLNYPDLKTSASIASAEAIETHALGGVGLPRHWYAHGDGTNRATAMAQGDPTLKTLQHDQDTVKEALVTMLTFARDQAEIAGAWRGKSGEFNVSMPEMATRDLSRVTSTLSQLVTALSAAVNDLKVITTETAAEAVAKVLAEIDIEYNPAEELQKARQAAQDAPQQPTDGKQAQPDPQAQQTAQKAQEWLQRAMEGHRNGR